MLTGEHSCMTPTAIHRRVTDTAHLANPGTACSLSENTEQAQANADCPHRHTRDHCSRLIQTVPSWIKIFRGCSLVEILTESVFQKQQLLWESRGNEDDVLCEHGWVSNSPGWPQARQAAEESLELLTLPLYFVGTVITPGSQQFLELFFLKNSEDWWTCSAYCKSWVPSPAALSSRQ